MRSTRSALSVFAVAGLLSLAGCASDSDESAPTVPVTAEATDTSTEDGEATTTTTEGGEATTTTGAEETTTTSVGAATSSEVTVTVDGDDVVFSPDKVVCSGEVGKIRRIVAKTGDGPPLVEVTWQEFMLVKLTQQGAPYKADRPSGVELGEESVTFADVFLGGAEVNGGLICTDWQD